MKVKSFEVPKSINEKKMLKNVRHLVNESFVQSAQ